MGRINDSWYTTGRDYWETPQDLFDKLNDEFHFTLDPCATPTSAKCSKYYTEEEDGLIQSWAGHTVFCNPPYSRTAKGNPGQAAWIKKAYQESLKGNTVVMLLPARTDTKAFHEYIYGKAEIRFIKGRLRYGSGDKEQLASAAPFPSMIVVFNPAS